MSGRLETLLIYSRAIVNSKPTKVSPRMLRLSLAAIVLLFVLVLQDQCHAHPVAEACLPTNCQVSDWSTWSNCSQSCGGSGVQTRTRNKTVVEACWGACSYNLSETRFCNRYCKNGGTPLYGYCACKDGFTGICCELATARYGRNRECRYYTKLSTKDRSMETERERTDVSKCDRYSISRGWYRFTGEAGTAMATKCVPKNHCGTNAPGWLSGSHPTEAEGRVYRQVCFNWNTGCCSYNSLIRVRNCGDFYVYELVSPQYCSLRYCGDGYVKGLTAGKIVSIVVGVIALIVFGIFDYYCCKCKITQCFVTCLLIFGDSCQ